MKFLNNSIALLGAIASMNFGVSLAEFRYSASDVEDIQGRYIAIFNDGTSVEDMAVLSQTVSSPLSAASAMGTSIFSNVIKGFATDMTPEEAFAMAERPDVKYVIPDGEVSIDAATDRWGLDRIDQEATSGDGQYSPTLTNQGIGVVAYVMDTGIQLNHEDFENRAEFGANFSGDGVNEDCNGHGTHVAGTVGGKESGVAKKVTLVDVKVLSCSGSGSYSGIINAFDWIASDYDGRGNPPSTANMSLGGGRYDPLNDALEALVAKGVTVVVAAGNESTDACSKSPASATNAITVASSTISDGRSSFSNYGTCVDIFAPGSGIKSSCYDAAATNTYCTYSGTSMASPHVCGVTALYLAENPNASPAAIQALMEGDALQNKISNPGSGSPNLLAYVGGETSTGSPVAAPVATPVAAPVATPVAAPVATPVAAPVVATDSPVAAPVVSPPPGDCEDGDEFALSRNRVQTCEWLAGKRERAIERICSRRTHYHNIDGIEYEPAHIVCPDTCDSCDDCHQFDKEKFFWKINGRGNKVVRSCGWIERIRNRDAARAEEICASQETDGIYPPAAEACPVSCGVGSC